MFSMLGVARVPQTSSCARVGSLFGVDISEEMLAQARGSVPDAEYRWYDGEKLPFPDETFDVVLAICVLHHFPESRRYKFVSEMVRVARSGGIVAVFEHNPLNPLTRHAVNSCQLDEDAVLLRSRETMELLREAAEVQPLLRHYLFSPSVVSSVARLIDISTGCRLAGSTSHGYSAHAEWVDCWTFVHLPRSPVELPWLG